MPDAHRDSAGTGPNLGHEELFGGSADPAATGPLRIISDRTVALPSPARTTPGPALPRWRTAHTAVVAAVLMVLVLALIGVWAAARPDGTTGLANPGNAAGAVPGAELAEVATRSDTDCVTHSYGQVRAFLAAHPCRALRRAVFSGTSSGTPVVIAVSTVTMPSPQDAAQLQQLADTDGTGNVADLLREGVQVPGAAPRLHNASYASQRRGQVLVIVEAATAAGAGSGLKPLAQAALRLGG